MLDIHFLEVVPPDSETLALTGRSWRFVQLLQIVCIRGWLLLRVPQYYLRYGSLVAFTESARFILIGRAQVWLQNVGIVQFLISEPVLLGEGVAVRSMPPGRRRLIPFGYIFVDRHIGIGELDSLVSR